MKKIAEEDMKKIDLELSIARKQFEEKNINSLEEKLEWIRNFFNAYVPELEGRFMIEPYTLPDEVRIKFYMYFPEHGLNMAKAYDKTAAALATEKQHSKLYGSISRSYFRHHD